MESMIDRRYRILLLEHYLACPEEKLLTNASSKWIFVCPFCGPMGRTEGKKKHRKGSLLWNAQQHSWVFSCAKKGALECLHGKTLGNFISALNPALGELYRRERSQAGTAGKGHNISSKSSFATTRKR
jgi:hypothetical protein